MHPTDAEQRGVTTGSYVFNDRGVTPRGPRSSLSDAGTAPRRRRPGTVGAAMLLDVKRNDAATTVGHVRRMFQDEHVHGAVIVHDGVLLAVLDRIDVEDGRDDSLPALAAGRLRGRSVGPDVRLEVALDALRRAGRRRLAVIEPDGTFLGLLCLKRSGRGCCSDRDIHARARDYRVGGTLQPA